MSEPAETIVIFTGRGGSGTRLLSQLADESDVFIGNHVNQSGDSIEWVDLVYRLAVESARWQALPTGAAHRQQIRDRAAQILAARSGRAAARWGLKLPETMLILPLLVDAFPEAKIVHLTRHPVSSSLRRTHMTSRLNNAVGATALPNAYRYCRRDVRSIGSDEPYVHNACSWNYQVRRVVEYARTGLDGERYIEIRYEDLCNDPASSVARVRSFLGCAPAAAPTAITVDVSRANRWDPDDPRVQTIWDLCGETALLLGYTLEHTDLPRQHDQSTQQLD